MTITSRSTPAALRRQRVHQHRRRIGRAPAGDVDARRIDRAPARAEADAGAVGLVAVLGDLLGVIGGDALGGEFERLAQFGRQALERGEAVGPLDPPAGLVQVVAVEPLGIGGDRGIALVAHRGDDRADVARDIGVGLAPGVDQRVELRGEIGSAVESLSIGSPALAG